MPPAYINIGAYVDEHTLVEYLRTTLQTTIHEISFKQTQASCGIKMLDLF
jgi:hypothetical protein